jgi:plastocyanin
VTPAAQLGAARALWGRRHFLWALWAAALVRPVEAAGLTVELRQFNFEPAMLEIAAGEVVTFVNLDVVPHTATGDSFDTGALKRSEWRKAAFDTPGEYRYLCRFHRHMTGTIRVS